MNKEFKLTYCYGDAWMQTAIIAAENWMEATDKLLEALGAKRASDLDYLYCREA